VTYNAQGETSRSIASPSVLSHSSTIRTMSAVSPSSSRESCWMPESMISASACFRPYLISGSLFKRLSMEKAPKMS